MNGTSTKLTTAGAAGAITGIIVWILNTYAHANIPAEVSVWGSTLIGFALGWWAPELATPKQAVTATVAPPKTEIGMPLAIAWGKPLESVPAPVSAVSATGDIIPGTIDSTPIQN